MVNIDCIMGLLDWNNPESVQEEGRTLAREVSCINVFIQPCDIMGLLDWNNPESVQDACAGGFLHQRVYPAVRQKIQQKCLR